MSTRKSVIASAVAALLALPLIVAAATQIGDISADGTSVYRGPEAGWVLRGHEYLVRKGSIVHTDERDMNAPGPAVGAPRYPRLGEVSPDGEYTYRGPQAGWVLRPHEYAITPGGIVHTDARDMNKPKPDYLARRADRAGDVSPDGQYVYRNPEAGWTLR